MSNVRPIFRDAAIKYYTQSREKSVFPRFTSPPVFLLLWMLFALFISAGFLAWTMQIPTYVSSTGFVTVPTQPTQATTQSSVTLFIPANVFTSLKDGQSVQIQFPAGGPKITGTISVPDHLLHSPAAISQRFGIPLTTVPVGLAVVSLDTNSSWHLYSRSLVTAQIHVGSRRVLSFVPGFDRLIGA